MKSEISCPLGLSKRVSRTAALLLAALFTTTSSRVPAADIPLILVPLSNAGTAFYRLGINVGIGSGAPKTYLFDTGSSLSTLPTAPRGGHPRLRPTRRRSPPVSITATATKMHSLAILFRYPRSAFMPVPPPRRRLIRCRHSHPVTRSAPSPLI
jgi:hypothetical protein